MSTRSTISHGPGFHLYHELFDDDDNLYLRVDDNRVCESCGAEHKRYSNTIVIPAHIWEVIRLTGAHDFSLLEKTDKDLFEMVEKDSEVDFWITEESPRELVIQDRVDQLKGDRAKQRKIHDKIQLLNKETKVYK